MLLQVEGQASTDEDEDRSLFITLIDGSDTEKNYGTFQSHNQKVVANAKGIFMTYLHQNSKAEDEKPNVWRLVHSKDGGRSFSTLYEGHANSMAPVMETDGEGNLYLAHPEYGTQTEPMQEFHFYRFLAAEGYRRPHISIFPDISCAAKYAMAYDAGRKRFYLATQYGRLLTIDQSGNLLHNLAVLEFRGPEAATQYPQLFVDPSGTLHHAWTTAGFTGYHYPSIHYLKSIDGGATWQKMDGTPVPTPAIPDWTGPSDVICLPDEYEVLTWLSSFWIKRGKAHFAYWARPPANRFHYMRFDLQTGQRDRDSWMDDPDQQWRGEEIVLTGMDGLFASDPARPEASLYAVQHSGGGRIGCLFSRDNGQTWQDGAISEKSYGSVYALGGCRSITAEGRIIGSFTSRADSQEPWKVYFFSIPVARNTGRSN